MRSNLKAPINLRPIPPSCRFLEAEKESAVHQSYRIVARARATPLGHNQNEWLGFDAFCARACMFVLGRFKHLTHHFFPADGRPTRAQVDFQEINEMKTEKVDE
mmetsp:Transcript_54823/g.95636  ORF Transcript_54823/g.95636 Transcript_54823/m.95636 type:complete len:104 (+) Transcript_54823:264-575(+)